MSNKKTTFNEMKNNEIERLTCGLNNFIKEQQINYERLAKLDTSDFLLVNALSHINQRNENIQKISAVLDKFRKFDNIKGSGAKRKELPNRELGEKIRTDFDLKTDGSWMKKTKCSVKQIQNISVSFSRMDKKLFFDTLLEITNNQALTDRYTKYFFQSSIKHKTKSSLLES